jgi:hypothetical protein
MIQAFRPQGRGKLRPLLSLIGGRLGAADSLGFLGLGFLSARCVGDWFNRTGRSCSAPRIPRGRTVISGIAKAATMFRNVIGKVFLTASETDLATGHDAGRRFHRWGTNVGWRFLVTTACSWLVILLSYQTPLLATTYYWTGAGTGGNTATDPSNPTTLWGTASNWSPVKVPGSSDTVWLQFANAGQVNAQNGSVYTVYVDGSAQTASLSIGSGVTFSASYNSYVGYSGLGSVV